MRTDPHTEEVSRLAAQLEHDHPIRLQMLAIVTLAAIAGFLVSFVLLHLGLMIMAIRYAIATAGGYGVFVVCVRVWLLGRESSSNLVNSGSARSSGLNLNLFSWGGGKSTSSNGDSLFKGGRSGGAGASAMFDAPQTGTMQTLAMTTPPPQSTSSGFSGLGNMKISGGKGKGVLPLIVIALIAIGIAVVARVVWQSPHLIAEMLVDGTFAGTAIRGARLAHRNREIDVVEHTWVPTLIVLVLMVSIGAAGQHFRPDAVSIGDLFR